MRACEAGDGKAVLVAAQHLHETVDGWRLALAKVSRLGRADAAEGMAPHEKGIS